MTPKRPPPPAGAWLLAALVAVFAGAMVLRSLAAWDVTGAAWWTGLLLAGAVAWYWTRARWSRKR